jgi:hypothetical protein
MAQSREVIYDIYYQQKNDNKLPNLKKTNPQNFTTLNHPQPHALEAHQTT